MVSRNGGFTKMQMSQIINSIPNHGKTAPKKASESN